jgi:hypothetical protein
MPDTCPHCGFRLPMVVDAYCPECREDLSEQPETIPTGDGYEARPHKPTDVALETVVCWVGVVLMVVGAFVAFMARDWLGFLAAVVMAGLLAAVARRFGRPPAIRTSVTGREKTQKHEDQLQ